jgi:hypothetical protein
LFKNPKGEKMFQPPDYFLKCSDCGYEVWGSDMESPIQKCPWPDCKGFMIKKPIKKSGPLEKHPFKKY